MWMSELQEWRGEQILKKLDFKTILVVIEKICKDFDSSDFLWTGNIK